jgi:hypothetical protein
MSLFKIDVDKLICSKLSNIIADIQKIVAAKDLIVSVIQIATSLITSPYAPAISGKKIAEKSINKSPNNIFFCFTKRLKNNIMLVK